MIRTRFAFGQQVGLLHIHQERNVPFAHITPLVSALSATDRVCLPARARQRAAPHSGAAVGVVPWETAIMPTSPDSVAHVRRCRTMYFDSSDEQNRSCGIYRTATPPIPAQRRGRVSAAAFGVSTQALADRMRG